MCLVVKEGEKIRTARKNIVVWKRLDPSNKSPCCDFRYYRGRIYTPVTLKINPWIFDQQSVHEGFHAYVNEESARLWIYSNQKIVRLIIPKGSKYVLGTYGEIVSSHIRFPKKGE